MLSLLRRQLGAMMMSNCTASQSIVADIGLQEVLWQERRTSNETAVEAVFLYEDQDREERCRTERRARVLASRSEDRACGEIRVEYGRQGRDQWRRNGGGQFPR